MKKRLAAAVVAALMLLTCLPFLAGCKADIVYTLNEDKTAYTVSVSGFASSVGGEIVIPETYGENNLPVTAIASQGFASTSISKITIPKTVEYIGISAFMYCNNLREVIFEEGSEIAEILNGAFAYCEHLTAINIPQTVKLIYPMAFMGCYELKNVDLPYGLQRIGYRAFYQCGLEQITVPASVRDEVVEKIGEDGEPELDEDGKPVTVTYMGIGYGAFHSCESLKLAVVKAEIETLYAGVFGYCLSLETVYLPKTLKKVEGAVFSGSTLYYGHVFHHDGALKNVYFAGTEEEWNAVEINNTAYKDSQVSTAFDNSSLINAENKYFGQTYGG